MGEVVIVGGTGGIGLELARHFVRRGRAVVVTGRRADRAARVAAGLDGPGTARGIALDLTEPGATAAALADVGEVDRLALVAVDRDQNTLADYDHGRATGLTILKLVGYTEVVHTLAPRLSRDASILLFGGIARERPYPGSTTVSIVNGGITGMVATLAAEMAPVRVNAIHPGVVADTPSWTGRAALLEVVAERTLTGRVPTMAEVVDASVFLLENRAVNAVDLTVDGGWRA
ncbi:SDR family oxidoreductase [Planomonospora sp. ID82291]|uniref:SDR family oxidoreductase n=1 Tax=Planomonospora sp. ID82291 TaxID=2738136 RepID=UPI0018C3EB0E|nr:SDR family oxidoreductase [Planomonospora sp. ID82291]MBG0817223.1 SDR family oxidoreductase [Planomonospora sp. ID82291]